MWNLCANTEGQHRLPVLFLSPPPHGAFGQAQCSCLAARLAASPRRSDVAPHDGIHRQGAENRRHGDTRPHP